MLLHENVLKHLKTRIVLVFFFWGGRLPGSVIIDDYTVRTIQIKFD